MTTSRGTAAVVAALLLLASARGRADQPTVSTQAQSELAGSKSADRPWVSGVSQAEQKAALELFREANALLKESLFVQAAEKYREALSHWNHPGIHYNLALALLNLDQPVAVYKHLDEALKYGPAPIDADKFEHANRYRALIEKQLARIDVTCSEPANAVVTMDGQTLFTAPGHWSDLVRIGQHTVVAEKKGYVTVQKTPNLPPGEVTKVDLRMFTAEQLTRYKRRWSVYMPIGIIAAGVVVAGLGGILQWQASESFAAYDRGINGCSVGSATGGCTPNTGLADKRSGGEAMQGTAFAAYGVGAALVAVGSTLAFLNRAHPYHVDEGEASPVVVAPVVSSNKAGVSVTVRF